MEKIEEQLKTERRESEDKFNDLFIFTTTLYGKDESSRVRAALAEEFLKRVEKLNIKCVVVDGGSSEEFLNRIRQLKNVQVVVDPSLGTGESRRKALEVAMSLASATGSPSFLYTDPEKEDLIKEESLGAMIESLREGKADIVVPMRKSMESYPKFQEWIEKRANKRAAKIMNENSDEAEFDLWFGPKMFNREGAKYFLEYRGKLDKWDSIIKPVADAYRAGKKIVSVPVDFKYPETQKQHEEVSRIFKQKRFEQYRKILAEMGDEFWVGKERKK